MLMVRPVTHDDMRKRVLPIDLLYVRKEVRRRHDGFRDQAAVVIYNGGPSLF